MGALDFEAPMHARPYIASDIGPHISSNLGPRGASITSALGML